VSHPLDVLRLRRSRALAVLSARLRARNFAESTIALNVRLARALLRAVGKKVRKIGKLDVQRYLADRARTVTPSTTARELDAIRNLFLALREDGLVEEDPTDGLAVEVEPARARTVLPPETVAAYLDAALVETKTRRSPEVRRAVALRNRAIVELIYGTGFRASEVAASRVTDLDLRAGAVLCRRAKRGVPATLPLPAGAVDHLDRYLREGRPHLAREDRDEGRVFLSERGRPLSPNDVLRVVWIVSERVGLRTHPHALRRSVATTLVRNGASVVAVKELLGHCRLETTQRYVATSLEDVRRAVELLDEGGSVRRSRT
jgi:site-specific recombinase XerD